MGILSRLWLLALSFCVLWVSGCASAPQKVVSNEEKARLLINVANASLNEGDPTFALIKLQEAEDLDTSMPELYHSKAIAFYKKGDLKQAEEAAMVAVKKRQDYSDALNTLGKIRIDLGKLKEAIEPLSLAANNALYADAYKARTNLGIAYYRLGNYDVSEREMDFAIKSSPALACVAHYYKGHIALRKQQFHLAVKEYGKSVLNFCGGFADAHLALGTALVRSRKYDQARKKFVEIRNQFPDTSVAEEAEKQLRYLP